MAAVLAIVCVSAYACNDGDTDGDALQNADQVASLAVAVVAEVLSEKSQLGRPITQQTQLLQN